MLNGKLNPLFHLSFVLEPRIVELSLGICLSNEVKIRNTFINKDGVKRHQSLPLTDFEHIFGKY